MEKGWEDSKNPETSSDLKYLFENIYIVHDLLKDYTHLHDEVFAADMLLNIRRVLPIPLLFKPIPYDSIIEESTILMSELEMVMSNLKACEFEIKFTVDRDLLDTFKSYVQVLYIAIERFKDLCGNLNGKIYKKKYKRKSYQQELDDYYKSIEDYMKIGAKLNNLIK